MRSETFDPILDHEPSETELQHLMVRTFAVPGNSAFRPFQGIVTFGLRTIEP
jgi:hypothetical protein